MHILGWLVFGLIVGAIAKLLVPGKDPGGWIVTILIGIAGSFLGGLVSQMFGGAQRTVGFIGSILGAIVLLLIYRLVIRARAK